MDKKVLKRTITDEEMLELSTRVVKMFPDELYATLGLYTAIVMADIFEDSEEIKNDHEAFVTYTAGKWKIVIATREDDKARLVMFYSDEKRIDRTLDSIYKAYNYAFNIICTDK